MSMRRTYGERSTGLCVHVMLGFEVLSRQERPGLIDSLGKKLTLHMVNTNENQVHPGQPTVGQLYR